MTELVTRNDLQAVRHDLEAVRRELQSLIETQTFKIMISMGTTVAAGIAILAAIIKL